MGYDAVEQQDFDHDVEDLGSTTSASPFSALASPNLKPPPAASRGLFLDDQNNTRNPPHSNGIGINSLVHSIASRRKDTKASYDEVESDDFAEDARSSPVHNSYSPSETFPLHIPRPRRPGSSATVAEAAVSQRSIPSKPILRTASGRSIALRHPTPDLQALQGAYTGNIQQLEKTAERLSMTSSIDDAIKELHDEQKRSDSRRSSLLSSQGISVVTRQISNASSIVEVNSAARSGGFSPAGYMMSPKGSFTTGGGGGRSTSRSSRFGSRPEPELEGRPLDSFVNIPSMSPTSPTFSPSASIAEMNEDTTTLTKPIVDLLASPNMDEKLPMSNEEVHRPTTSASTNTYEQEKMFADFDGIHAEPQQRTVSGNESNNSNNTERRTSSGNRLSMTKPQSYADPTTGQQMVYYPAPVPMMLNLPQKLSKNPSSMARNKRRSQVLSSIPPAARQSAVWLPDVLEAEDEPELAEDDAAQQQEYIPQHQRASMGGRRLTQDLSHMPAQLRANAYFELPGVNQTVELKEQSAVATLDSILDASAHAPVSAFTDHAFAGRLGAEVYGRPAMRHSRTNTQLLDPPSKKRTSSFNLLLRGRRASSSDVLDSDKETRRATMSGLVESKIRSPIEDDDEDGEGDTAPLQQSELEKGEGDEESDEGQRDDEIYQGPPTTLLAELQLRKQQQKQRTRPLFQAFPNGMHSTLLEMDAVAQVEQKSRKQKRINLAWEDPSVQHPEDEMGDDEDVPLAMLYAKKEVRDPTRPMGLMERRDMEDNEPLSRRRDRLQGRPPVPRASTMMHISSPMPAEEEEETLAERVRRLKEQNNAETGLPTARPVSGDFASEMMSQFGGDLLHMKDPKGKGKETSTSPGPEEETLGQRRKRLQAEREARAKEVNAATGDAPPQQPEINKRRSMADILQAHPSAGASRVISYQKPVGGLLGLHEKQSAQRSSTMLDFNTSGLGNGHRANSGGFKSGLYNDGQGGIIPPAQPLQNSFNTYGNNAPFPQPSLGFTGNPNAVFGNQMMFANPYAVAYPGMQVPMGYMPNMNGMNMGMNMNMGMGMGMQPLNQGQIDMVERWRQSVMQ